MDNITTDEAQALRELALFAGAGGASSEESSLAGKQSAPSNLSPTPQQCYALGKTTGFSRLSQYGMTCEALTETLGRVASILFPEAFPARTFPVPEKEPGSTEPEAVCGENLRELSARFDPDSCSWKTATSLLNEDLPESSVILPRSGTMRSGKLWERTTSAPRADEQASGSRSGLRVREKEDDRRQWWSVEPDVGRVADGVAARVDRLKAIGNGQVPLVAATAFCRLLGRIVAR